MTVCGNVIVVSDQGNEEWQAFGSRVCIGDMAVILKNTVRKYVSYCEKQSNETLAAQNKPKMERRFRAFCLTHIMHNSSHHPEPAVSFVFPRGSSAAGADTRRACDLSRGVCGCVRPRVGVVCARDLYHLPERTEKKMVSCNNTPRMGRGRDWAWLFDPSRSFRGRGDVRRY